MNASALLELSDAALREAWRRLPLEERGRIPADETHRLLVRLEDLNQREDRLIEATVGESVERSHANRPRDAQQLPRVWLDDATMPAQDASLIKGILGAATLAIIYGAPSCGKTFVALDMGAHVSAGMPWRGMRTKAGLVVYIAAEAGRSILRRFIAWRERYIGDTRGSRVPLCIVTRAVNLMLPVEVEELVLQLREIAAEAGSPLVLVVIDTLSRSMPGGDENATVDMGRVIAAADRIREEFGAAALIVHHSGKDASKGARGHSALVAAADTVIAVADHVATLEKVRDGVAGQAFPFALDVVQMGLDEDGDPITTCIAVPAEYGSDPAPMPRAAPLGKNQEKALAVLRKLFAAVRRNLEQRGDDPAGACILIEGWRDALEKAGINRFRFREIYTALQEREAIRIDGPHVFPTEPSA